jgi:ornithine carbamoyltransferase
MSLVGRSLLTLKDYTAPEIRALLDRAHRVKKEARSGVLHQRFRGMTLALIFEKLSTRTRAAFETAFGEEGGYPVFLSSNDIHLGAKETLPDTARVLGRMFSAIAFRGFKQRTVSELAEFAGVPVYNGLTDDYHPTQVLADLMTLEEQTGKVDGCRIAYLGDGRNNVATSLMLGCAALGVHIAVVCPPDLAPSTDWRQEAESRAAESGATVTITGDVAQGVRGADAVYTDVWASMGEEQKLSARIEQLTPYRVTPDVMQQTGNSEAVFLHCLPAVRGNEVAAEVIDGSRSRVWDQAENRKHTIKAMMLETLGV